MVRYVDSPNLPDRYTTITLTPDGVLNVSYISTHPGVRASGEYHFKPGSTEYKEIMRELGELTVGEMVVIQRPMSPENQALLDRNTPLEELKRQIIERSKQPRKSEP